MKENINNLTALLIVVSVSVLSYHYINKEKVETTEETTEQIIEEVETVEIEIEEVTPVSQVVISGKITWPINREARFFTRDTSITTYVDWIGRFSLTFPLDSAGYLTFHHGRETTAMYCNPDDTVYITIDSKQFDETITYKGSDESNYLAWKYLHQENTDRPDVYNSTTEELNEQLENLINPMIAKLEDGTKFYNSETTQFNAIRNHYLKRHEQIQALPKVGEAAIDFTYPDKDGNMVSLSDFKGSCVYVDVWATWCGPCKFEIPYLKQLESEAYHGENIVFLSVSVDTDRKAWLKMIDEKELGGVQLFANGWSADIMKNYAINGIPRFMLFNAEGNVVSLDAPRPSHEVIFSTLNDCLGF